jgi:hypothetical protein
MEVINTNTREAANLHHIELIDARRGLSQPRLGPPFLRFRAPDRPGLRPARVDNRAILLAHKSTIA